MVEKSESMPLLAPKNEGMKEKRPSLIQRRERVIEAKDVGKGEW
jgi:hypothetical protein